ncbi:glycosyltransferase [Pseudomonas guariconensis]|uniref:glycosyltransferase n=1 Tax=Pseudomonas guariconensis TaxID=1288410 RepID=UPI002D1F3D86|nr:glycosyltransferase [Pseudomonas guariconensis]MEB3840443.1 glycosyltransferase [Pseudomonas guariconensis]MEB3873311.1 glycosyltransferase [Pseudomonas guariconensis]MEB3878688.1 glycosyltransferase [Pseudomonas guariconensis]MEB3896165.1 glycosyltransferase [Pseudomonas guariconensis]
MKAQPLVTIAIPAFNSEFFYGALSSAIAQDYPNLEIVICDDSANGDIEALCEAIAKTTTVPLRYLRNPSNLGYAHNLLACLAQARGELIKFLCDDDSLLTTCITQQAQVLIDHASVSMVSNQRLLCDADDVLLPSRMLNWLISSNSAVLHGTDLLDCVADNAINLFGGISHVLFRRAQVEAYLATLVQEGGFRARVDMALYVCLLRRGHLCSLAQILSLERVHPGRLSHRVSMTEASKVETTWLLQILQARTSESAPAKGWVRYLPLQDFGNDPEHAWEEMNLRSAFAEQMDDFKLQVGTDSLSFAEVYSQWLACRTLSEGQLGLLSRRIEQWPHRPRILVVVFGEGSDQLMLGSTLDSLATQSFPAGRICVVGAADSGSPRSGVEYLRPHTQEGAVLNALLADDEQSDWVFLLQAGDRLHPQALLLMAERMALRADSLCLYTDEGAYDGRVSSDPVFKPDFNLDLMRSQPYVGRQLAFKCDAVRELGGFDERFARLGTHDLLWRMVESHGVHVVEHIAELLVQSQYTYRDWLADPRCQAEASVVVEAHLQRLGVAARVEAIPGSMMSRIHYQHAYTAGVSILIHAGDDVLALQRCVESLFEHTRYDAYEVLLIANGSEPVEVRDWLDAMGALGGASLRVVEVQAQGRGASLNQACEYARGEFLLLLDVGCIAFDGPWLQELMLHAQRPEVGVVGPKLFGQDGGIASGALVLGFRGPAGNPFQWRAAASSNDLDRLNQVQNWSALSLDCLLVRRELFQALHGLDVQAMPHAWSDADLCLRAREQGFLVVWTPYAKLASVLPRMPVGIDEAAQAQGQQAFYERWLSKVANDPAYNHNLSLNLISFNLEPGVRGGWDPFIAKAAPSVLAVARNTSGVGHYRVIQPFSELERASYIQGRLTFKMPNPIELAREKADALIMQYRYSPSDIKRLTELKQVCDTRLIFELDDYAIDPPKKNDHARNQPSNVREMLGKAIGLCDRLVVSTEPLADALSSFHHDIRVVPNMLAASLWDGLRSDRQTSARPRVGWAGGTSHRGDLELMLGVVQALADQVDWVFFGMCPPMLQPYIKEFYPNVPMAEYPQKLASLNLDLALAPLEQNLFNECKSNLRLLEYGVCGYPVICTDIKAYAGYLPCTRVKDNTTEQWLAAIRMHLADPQASYRQGDALREAVLRDYVLTPHHVQHWANAWLAD